MSPIKLKRLLAKQPQTRTLIDLLDPQICIIDAAGLVVYGAEERQLRFPILLGDEVIGWVSGTQPELVARLLTVLVQQETEKIELADATLDLYREINLLYALSDKLAVSLDLDTIAEVIAAEVRRIVSADRVLVVLHEVGEAVRIFPVAAALAMSTEKILRPILDSAKAELIDDLVTDPRWAGEDGTIGSLGYSPLKIKDRFLGLIVLMNNNPTSYRASDLKLLNMIAAQAVSTIDNALLYQRAAHEAAEREARLQQQIRELRIEIDEQRQQQKVAEITETDYFRNIREQRETLRKLLEKPDG